MDTENKLTKSIVNAVPIALIIILAILIGYRSYDHEFDVFASLSGVAALAVAYLTVAYVLTTSQQLNVMREQLAEMKKGRELVDQPLPTIEVKEMHLVKPNFYYTPPTGRYSWQSLAELEVIVRNISKYPAVNVCIYPTIFVDEGDDKFCLSEYAHFFEILGQNKISKKFILTEDENGKILKALTAKNKPRLVIKVLYKNILGSSFLSEHHYNIYPGNFKKAGMEDYKKRFDLLKQWNSKMKSFDVDFRNEMAAIKNLTPHKSGDWWAQFDSIQKRFLESLEGEQEFILETILNSSKYKISVIDNKSYDDEVEAKRDRR